MAGIYTMFIFAKGGRANEVSLVGLYGQKIYTSFDGILEIKTVPFDWSVVIVETSNDFVLLNTQVHRFGKLIEISKSNKYIVN